MDCEVLGWPDAGPTLALDHERFAYAGKFRMSNTGKAVGRASEDGPMLAAAAFNADRTEDSICWIRYITVRRDRQGEGLGPELARFVVEAATGTDETAVTAESTEPEAATGNVGGPDDGRFDAVQIAVNNPYAYEAMYRAGFAYTGETTGIAELVLATDAPMTADRYRSGMSRYAARDDDGASFAAERSSGEPPALR